MKIHVFDLETLEQKTFSLDFKVKSFQHSILMKDDKLYLPSTISLKRGPGFLILDLKTGFFDFQQLIWEEFKEYCCFSYALVLGSIFCVAWVEGFDLEEVLILWYDENSNKLNVVSKIPDVTTEFDDYKIVKTESISMELINDKLHIIQNIQAICRNGVEGQVEKLSFLHILKITIEDEGICCSAESMFSLAKDVEGYPLFLTDLFVLEL